MKTIKCISTEGWDIQTAGQKLYFRINDEYGENDEYYEYDLQTIRRIEESDFLCAKLGKHYQRIIEQFGQEPTAVEWMPDGSLIATEFVDFYIHIFDKDGNLLRKIEDIGFDSIYGIAFEPPDYLWCAIPTANSIRKYRLSDSKELFGIGDYDDETVLEYPEDVEVYGNYLYISDLRHNRVCRLDLQTYQTETYWQFEHGGPYSYKRIGNVEFAERTKGIFEMRDC